MTLPATITADPFGLLVAFGGGILSFLSPCVLPLVPGYLSLVTGLEAAELEARAPSPEPVPEPVPERRLEPAVLRAGSPRPSAVAMGDTHFSTVHREEERRTSLRPLLVGIGLFIAGFTVVFVALGAAASGLGHLLGAHKQLLSTVSGGLVIAFGGLLLVGALPAGVWLRLGSGPAGAAARVIGERRFSVRPTALGAWAAPVMGMAFAFAWTPCIGPVLGAITALAATRATVGGGALLLLAYSLGLGVPFLVTGLAFGRLTTFFSRARRGLGVVHLVGGAVLVVFGILLVTHQLGWLSDRIQDLLRDVGLGRLSTS